MVVALDAVTGLPLDASYLTQYQIPLGSQPINLEELGALGRQSTWLYPDNLPGVVSRLQARDNTNPLNAQDLSTDGKRNLNVNIAAGDSSNSRIVLANQVLSVNGPNVSPGLYHNATAWPITTLYGFQGAASVISSLTGTATLEFLLCDNAVSAVLGLYIARKMPRTAGTDFDINVMFPGGIDIEASMGVPGPYDLFVNVSVATICYAVQVFGG